MSGPTKFSDGGAALVGAALFLFIPVVLYLFVAHPSPVAASVAVGVVLMLSHRFLARPYFLARRPSTCAWCHRSFDAKGAVELALDLEVGGERIAILACASHVDPTRRFFGFLDAYRHFLRASIGLPLAALLLTLAALAAGSGLAATWERPVTDLFRFVIGVTVHVVALGPFAGAPVRSARAVFPVHNFYLLGIRATLWVLRLVGVWWIVSAGHALLSRL